MPPRQLPSGRFMADIMIHGKRYRKAFSTLEEAVHHEALLQVKAAKGLPITDGNGQIVERGQQGQGILLQDLLELADNVRWKSNKDGETACRLGQWVVNYFGQDRDAGQIDSTDVDEMVEHLQDKGNAPATINRKLAALSTMLHLAQKRRLICYLPDMSKQRENNGRIRYFTAKEEEAILKELKRLGYSNEHDLIIVLLDTGLRVMEACGLLWENIHEDYLIAENRKNGENTNLPMTKRVQTLMQDRRISHGHEAGPFAEVCDNARLLRRWVEVRRSLNKIDDKQFIPHTCRHTFISRLVQRGVPIKVVQDLAGHKTLAMTMRYSHLAPSNYRDAIKTLE